MRFISNGDYIFPLRFSEYWQQHVSMWSYQHGAANPDGIIRLPGRLIELAVFALFGNMAAAYFYILLCLVVAFVAFWWFARTFLAVQRASIALVGALFFACNPIFLGNLSKVGLILAGAMLPVCLTALRQGFKRRRLSYFLLYILALNISLLHPFTFAVALIVSAIYLAVLIRGHRVWVRDNLLKLGLMLLGSIVLNAYLILPLASLGTIDKSALSDSVTSTPADYTGLVDIANTGDLFTGLSLSKGVFKDYEFYGRLSWPFYFLGVFALYVLLFGLYLGIERRLKPRDRRHFVVAISVFLFLIILSTATYLHASVLIKWLVGMPGGWIFRSPLKWQLYIPLVLFMALVIALKYVRSSRRLKLTYAGLGIIFVFMNGYICTQIYSRLIKPRSLVQTAAFASLDLHKKNLLYVGDDRCLAVARDNPTLATELNEIFISNQLQVKRVTTGRLAQTNLAPYDFVLGCGGTLDRQLLAAQYDFSHVLTIAGGAYELYVNRAPLPYAFVLPQTFALQDGTDIAGMSQFARSHFSQPFSFVSAASHPPSTTMLYDLFGQAGAVAAREGALQTSLSLPKGSARQLFKMGDAPLYAKVAPTSLTLSTTAGPGLSLWSNAPLQLPASNDQLTASYYDSGFNYKNLLANPSFEQGPWQQEVGDCNAYDEHPDLLMRTSTSAKTDGKQSLELGATKHIACTKAESVAITPGKHYLLTFDYASPNDAEAGYFISFDDLLEHSVSDRLPATNASWKRFSTDIVAPEGGEHLSLMIYAYPSRTPGESGLARYDNFKLMEVPAIQNRFYLTTGTPAVSAPPAIRSTRRNPTKQLISIHAARTPFYLATKETYHRLWNLSLDTGKGGLHAILPASTKQLAGAAHLRINDTFNGWYIDPQVLCAGRAVGCTRQADGSYDIALVMEFTPQRWFYMGSLISLAAGIVAVGFVILECRQKRGQA